MLTYQKGYGGFFVLLRFAGTSWPHGVVPGLLAASISLVLSLVKDADTLISDKNLFIRNPYPYQLFAYLVGFILVFRTNFGYSRYVEAIDAMSRMGSKWLDGACMAVAFDAKGDASSPYLQSSIIDDDSDEIMREITATALDLKQSSTSNEKEVQPKGLNHVEFFVQVVHLFSLMHALALMHLRCDTDLGNIDCSPLPKLSHMDGPPTHSSSKSSLTDFVAKDVWKASHSLKLKVLGGLLEEERRALQIDEEGHPSSSAARVAQVESWIMRRLTARQKYEPAGDMGKTAPPILSRMVQVVSDGNLAFSQAAKVAETPFPFPYHNIISLFLWMLLFTVPFVINSKVSSIPARALITFTGVWAYFSLAEVGDNLEDPFLPYDPNDLPLEAIHHSFNVRLLSFGVVPKSSPTEAPEVL
mmetsp:Transcript_71805/g.162949  ORF Transcript_71805/g.162949 Transcript_71805/m.162949 type:complete len:415 (+) Transcript_71805:148-1392(+)